MRRLGLLKLSSAPHPLRGASSVQDVEAYLAGPAIPQIGPTRAHRLVTLFGPRIFDVLDYFPHLMTRAAGVDEPAAQEIHQAWNQQDPAKIQG